MCEAILARIEDKNPHDATGITPLHISVEQSNFRIAKLILDNLQTTPFYNPNPPDSDGETPLHLAARRGNFDIFSYIFERVIYQRVLTTKQLEDRDLEGCTPFVYICSLLSNTHSMAKAKLNKSKFFSIKVHT